MALRRFAPRILVPGTLALLLCGCLPAVTWLPDGQRIAYVQGGVVWLTDLAGQRTKLYAATGETPWFVTAAPAGDRLAVVSVGPGHTRLAILDDTGRVEWSVTFPGNETGDSAAPGLTFPANPWGPHGTRLLVVVGQTGIVMDLTTRSVIPLAESTLDARFSPTGELLLLTGTCTGGLTLVGVDSAGVRGRPIRWRVPTGTPENVRPRLTANASAAWLAQAGSGARTVLADWNGKILFTSARELESAGPDDKAYLTRDGGWALIRAGGPVTNLNPAYNRLVQAEINWWMEDTDTNANDVIKPEPEFMSLPAWSPDHSRFAVMTKSMLVVVAVATNTVTPLAKW